MKMVKMSLLQNLKEINELCLRRHLYLIYEITLIRFMVITI